MSRQAKSRIMWSIGLPPEEAEFIAGCAGDSWRLTAFELPKLPSQQEFDTDAPFFIWIAQAAWHAVGEAARDSMQYLGLVPHVLVLDDATGSLPDLAEGPSPYIITRPLVRRQVLESINKSVEARTLYSDMLCMTRELLLERELLAGKNATLSFLVTFLAQTAEGLEPEDIFSAAYANLPSLLPVTALHGVSWQGMRHDRKNCLEFFLATDPESNAEQSWRTLLLETAQKLNPSLHSICLEATRVTRLSQSAEARLALPEKQRVYLMPLVCGSETTGAMAILTQNRPQLGKDQATALRSAMQHAALALRNSLLFREARELAESDMLTGLLNRHAFDIRLREELERHIRYGNPLSLVQLDLDHFKKINDSHGHQAGDAALAATGAILRNSLRTLDIAARYGGEEFVILLPHTDAEQARQLAERLRASIARQRIVFQQKPIRFTASLGIATLNGAPALPRGAEAATLDHMAASIIFQADAALYQAKADGRNRVCLAAHLEDTNSPFLSIAAG